MAHLDYANRSNLDYMESLFQQYLRHPGTVHREWEKFFQGMELATHPSLALTGQLLQKELRVFELISEYRERGHTRACLNPLTSPSKGEETPLPFGPDLHKDPQAPFPGGRAKPPPLRWGTQDWDRVFRAPQVLGLPEGQTLRQVLSFLNKTYCSTLSLQVESCSAEVKQWFFREFESLPSFRLGAEQKKNILHSLVKTEALEKFLHSRFVGAKRFSIEGADALIPMLEELAQKSPAQNIKEIVMGMAHRGRLNVLNNFMNQNTEIIFMEFDGSKALEHFDFDGDVKYHAGYSSVKKIKQGHSCNVLLAYNPSHLEAVGSVVLGITRARQRILKDQNLKKAVLPVLIHGDGAFSGQGVVSETLQLSRLKGFGVGGTLHIILNNQIGFTTNPGEARSSFHASDLAKSIGAPVLLVNADDVESCIRSIDMALRFRQRFGRDVFIDLICYRRFGHNEGDEPAFTQPLMYQKIKKHPRVRSLYSQKLQAENILKPEEDQTLYDSHIQNLQTILDKTRKAGHTRISKEDLKGTLWTQHIKVSNEDFFKPTDTCPPDHHLNKVFEALTHQPRGFNLHPKVRKLIESRAKKIKEDRLDWALCELAAYGTLCLENHPVRLSGQDCQRGTFSHRHAVYFDSQTGRPFSPLGLLNVDRGEVEIHNSSLSEMAVLGFEYGKSCTDPSFLTVWEAQFGDFSNGGQIIIDQFISSGEEKWMQSSGLVLLLPHGYEGQGPEHSSARLERWLQLCAQGNLQVCYPSTPAGLFHLLRRQVKRPFRKPLVVMTPKSLLRHPQMVSGRKDLVRTSVGFSEVLGDTGKKPGNIETALLCSGKVFFDLQEEKTLQNRDLNKVAFVRMEQFYPFPSPALTPYLNGYPHLKKVLWVQEEPYNMGAWPFISHRLRGLMDDLGLNHLPLIPISRQEKASPATGSIQIHQREYQKIMEQVCRHLP